MVKIRQRYSQKGNLIKTYKYMGSYIDLMSTQIWIKYNYKNVVIPVENATIKEVKLIVKEEIKN